MSCYRSRSLSSQSRGGLFVSDGHSQHQLKVPQRSDCDLRQELDRETTGEAKLLFLHQLWVR